MKKKKIESRRRGKRPASDLLETTHHYMIGVQCSLPQNTVQYFQRKDKTPTVVVVQKLTNGGSLRPVRWKDVAVTDVKVLYPTVVLQYNVLGLSPHGRPGAA